MTCIHGRMHRRTYIVQTTMVPENVAKNTRYLQYETVNC